MAEAVAVDAVTEVRKALAGKPGAIDSSQVQGLLDHADAETARANTAEAKASALQAGLDGAHGRLAELEAKLDPTTGFETAEMMRSKRLAQSETPDDLARALDRVGKMLEAATSVARRVNHEVHASVIDARSNVQAAIKRLVNLTGGPG